MPSFLLALAGRADREAGTAGTGGAFPPKSAATDSKSDVLQRFKLSTTDWYSCSGVGGAGVFTAFGSLDLVRLRVASCGASASSALTILVSGAAGFASGSAGGSGLLPHGPSADVSAASTLVALLAWLAFLAPAFACFFFNTLFLCAFLVLDDLLPRAFLEFFFESFLDFLLPVAPLLPAGASLVTLLSLAAGGEFFKRLRAELGGSEALRGLALVLDRFDKERVRAIGVPARLILAGGVCGEVLAGDWSGRAARPCGVATLRKPS